MGARANTVHGFAHGLNGGSAGGTTGTRLFARLAHADAAVGFNDELHAGAAFLESEKVTNFLGDRDLPLDGKRCDICFSFMQINVDGCACRGAFSVRGLILDEAPVLMRKSLPQRTRMSRGIAILRMFVGAR